MEIKCIFLIFLRIFQNGRRGCKGEYMFALKSALVTASDGHS